VLRAAGETETTQENIQDWLELDGGDPGLQLLFIFISAIYIITFSSYLFSKFFFSSSRAIFCFIIPDYPLN
jgi:hypothetical protein